MAPEVELPTDHEFEVAPHWNPDESADNGRAVRAMLADHKKKLDQHQNLTWENRAEVRAPNGHVVPTDKRVRASGFDGRLAYMGPFPGNFYIQNRRIFLGRQRIVELKDVPTTLKLREKGADGWEHIEINPRELVSLALSVMDQQIMEGDPMRCKVCIEFRGIDEMELMAHFRRKHPKELDLLVDGVEKLRAEAEAQTPPPPATASPAKMKRQTFRAAS